jgi:hypothetical protein
VIPKESPKEIKRGSEKTRILEAFKEKNCSYMAFTTSMKNVGGSIECERFVFVEICDEKSQDDSDERLKLQEAYNQLFKEYTKQKKVEQTST